LSATVVPSPCSAIWLMAARASLPEVIGQTRRWAPAGLLQGSGALAELRPVRRADVDDDAEAVPEPDHVVPGSNPFGPLDHVLHARAARRGEDVVGSLGWPPAHAALREVRGFVVVPGAVEEIGLPGQGHAAGELSGTDLLRVESERLPGQIVVRVAEDAPRLDPRPEGTADTRLQRGAGQGVRGQLRGVRSRLGVEVAHDPLLQVVVLHLGQGQRRAPREIVAEEPGYRLERGRGGGGPRVAEQPEDVLAQVRVAVGVVDPGPAGGGEVAGAAGPVVLPGEPVHPAVGHGPLQDRQDVTRVGGLRGRGRDPFTGQPPLDRQCVERVVQGDEVRNPRGEIRRGDHHPGQSYCRAGPVRQLDGGRHRAIRDVVEPAVVLGEVAADGLPGQGLGAAEAAEDQEPASVRLDPQFAQRHVPAVIRDVQRRGPPAEADRAGTGVEDQVPVLVVVAGGLVTAVVGVGVDHPAVHEARGRALAVHEVRGPGDARFGRRQLGGRGQVAVVVALAAEHAETGRLPFEGAGAVAVVAGRTLTRLGPEEEPVRGRAVADPGDAEGGVNLVGRGHEANLSRWGPGLEAGGR
jgi:hypothetical protein